MIRSSTACQKCGSSVDPGGGGRCSRCLAEALLKNEFPENSADDSGVALDRLGDYELLEEIARGGMGVVYRARQRSLKREVAIKVMRDSAVARPEDIRRFLSEATAAAKLKHPHIVAIHEVGEQDGRHFFAMELIDGQNLAEHTRDSPLAARVAAQIVASIAEAVQHAHEQGILHRDIKPSNVLIDAAGKPYVTDFGLARALDVGSSLTLTGQVLGTPGYMPPEQATGQSVIGPGADIYSLSALLYHLLTGRPPFDGRTVAETLRQVVEREPVSPSVVNPAVPCDLASISLKGLAKRINDRYRSAFDLSADLHRFLRGEPTLARPIASSERLWRWCQRQPALAGASLLAVAASLGIAISVPAYRGANAARKTEAKARIREQEQREIAEQALGELRKLNYLKNIGFVERELLTKDAAEAETLLEECSSGDRDWEWHYLKRLILADKANPAGGRVIASADRMFSLSWSYDGTRIVCLGNSLVTALEPQTGRNIFTHAHAIDYGRISVNPAGDRYGLASIQPAGSLISARLSGEQDQPIVLEQARGYDLDFSPDGRTVATCQQGGQPTKGEVKIWEYDSGRLLRTVGTSTNGFMAVRFSPAGNLLAAADCTWRFSQFAGRDNKRAANTIRVWRSETGALVRSLVGHRFCVWDLAFTPDGKRLVSCAGPYKGESPGEIKVWDLETGTSVFDLRGHKACIFSVSVNSNGTRLASGGGAINLKDHPEEIRIWDLVEGRQLLTLNGHSGAIYDLAFSPRGDYLASASSDGAVRLWDASPLPEEIQIDLSRHYNAALADEWLLPEDAPARFGLGQSLTQLPQGRRRLGGVRFNIQGILQLNGKMSKLAFIEKAHGIKVRQRFRKIHFLHATGGIVADGTEIGHYVLRYADGRSISVPLVYGDDVREWQGGATASSEITHGVVAWSQSGGAQNPRLFRSTWTNSLPDVQVETIDFGSAMTDCFPFLIAITVE